MLTVEVLQNWIVDECRRWQVTTLEAAVRHRPRCNEDKPPVATSQVVESNSDEDNSLGNAEIWEEAQLSRRKTTRNIQIPGHIHLPIPIHSNKYTSTYLQYLL